MQFERNHHEGHTSEEGISMIVSAVHRQRQETITFGARSVADGFTSAIWATSLTIPDRCRIRLSINHSEILIE